MMIKSPAFRKNAGDWGGVTKIVSARGGRVLGGGGGGGWGSRFYTRNTITETTVLVRPISAPSVVKVMSIGSFSFYFCSFSTRKTCSTVSAIFLYAFALSMAS